MKKEIYDKLSICEINFPCNDSEINKLITDENAETKLFKNLKNVINDPKKNLIGFCGEIGHGKTTLLNKYFYLYNKNIKFKFIKFNIYENNNFNKIKIYEKIYKQIIKENKKISNLYKFNTLKIKSFEMKSNFWEEFIESYVENKLFEKIVKEFKKYDLIIFEDFDMLTEEMIKIISELSQYSYKVKFIFPCSLEQLNKLNNYNPEKYFDDIIYTYNNFDINSKCNYIIEKLVCIDNNINRKNIFHFLKICKIYELNIRKINNLLNQVYYKKEYCNELEIEKIFYVTINEFYKNQTVNNMNHNKEKLINKIKEFLIDKIDYQEYDFYKNFITNIELEKYTKIIEKVENYEEIVLNENEKYYKKIEENGISTIQSVTNYFKKEDKLTDEKFKKFLEKYDKSFFNFKYNNNNFIDIFIKEEKINVLDLIKEVYNYKDYSDIINLCYTKDDYETFKALILYHNRNFKENLKFKKIINKAIKECNNQEVMKNIIENYEYFNNLELDENLFEKKYWEIATKYQLESSFLNLKNINEEELKLDIYEYNTKCYFENLTLQEHLINRVEEGL